MEKIGQKIKRIRQEKGFTQLSIYPENQSLIAQIEGKNYKSNPTSGTLTNIAKGLEISFSDLIKDTDWKEVSPRLNRDEFSISEMNFDVSMESNGTIKVIFEEYPRYDTDGEQNRFCPTSGFELVTKCKACGKKFLNSSQVFCMGCGERLFFKYEQHFDELEISDKSFLLINKNGRKLADAMDELDKIIKHDIWGRTPKGRLCTPENLKFEYESASLGQGKEMVKEFMIINWEQMGGQINHHEFKDYLDGFQTKDEKLIQLLKKNTIREKFIRNVAIAIRIHVEKLEGKNELEEDFAPSIKFRPLAKE